MEDGRWEFTEIIIIFLKYGNPLRGKGSLPFNIQITFFFENSLRWGRDLCMGMEREITIA